MKMPLVSVIVPNYNHEKYLVQRLDSVFNQTYSNIEVILMDDCSTDNSIKILSKYSENPKVSHCIFNEINSGNTFVQWNKGILLAKGEYIWIAETDDFCDLVFLETLLEPLINDSNLVLAYCQSNRVNEDNLVTGNWVDFTDDLDTELLKGNPFIEGDFFIEKGLIYKNIIPNASAVLFKRNRAIEIGCLDINPSFKYVGDWIFYFNIIINNKIIFIEDSLNNFRYHSQSVIATSLRNGSELDMFTIFLETRKKLDLIISSESPKNTADLLKINTIELKKTIYRKANFFIKNHNKIKGYLLMSSIFMFFLKERNVKNIALSKMKKLLGNVE